MDENRPEKFTFYEIYATIIDGMKDEEAGRMIRRICSYMFGNGGIEEITDKRERYLWGNIAEELRETKEKELAGKTPKTLNKRMRHFTFPNNFYEAIELMDDRQSGAYIKAICRYMFRDEEPEKLPSPVDTIICLPTGLYGAEGITVYPDGRNLGEAFAAAVNSLPQNIYRNPEQSLEETVQGLDESVFDIRPMCYISVNGKLYMRIGEKLEQQELPNFPKDAYERIAGMIALRDELRLVLDIQTRGCTDEELRRAQWKLNADYDRFVRKYGYINSQTNTRLFREDGDAALLFACEVLSEDKTRATKADVFTKRTIRPYSAPTHTNDALEALQICRNERGGVDIAYIEELTGKDYDTVINELGDAVYRDPEMVESEHKYSGYQTAEEYLSGKVVEKLQKAKYYASHNSAYSSNVAALEKVQPEPLKADEISVRIGASWVKPEYYKQFLMELLDIYWYYEDGLTIRYNPFDNSWKVERADHVRKSAGMYATEKYGTSRANAFRLFEDCLNQRATSIYDTVEEDGREKRVLNQAETIAAREKQNKIKEEFADWIYADPKRREDLEKTYNSLFNQIRLPCKGGEMEETIKMSKGNSK